MLSNSSFEIDFKEDTNPILKSNKIFNKRKSELYLEQQKRLLTLEQNWHIKKTSALRKYTQTKKTLDEEMDSFKYLKKVSITSQRKHDELNTRFLQAKEEYKKNISESASEYNEQYLKITNFYNFKINNLRKEVLLNYDEFKVIMSKNEVNVEIETNKINIFKSKFKEKVEIYNNAVKKLNLAKNNFINQVNVQKGEIAKSKSTLSKIRGLLEKEQENLNANKQQFEIETNIQLNELEEEKNNYIKESKEVLQLKIKLKEERTNLVRLILNINISNEEEAERLLELNMNYNIEDLKTSYKRLALQYHPDHNKENKDFPYFNNHMFNEVKKSYDMLKNKFIF